MDNDNNIENEDDDEDFMPDEADLDDEDDDDEEADDNLIEGGVAEEEGASRGRSASTADITLFLSCLEKFKDYPDHPVLQPGITVSIGLDKNTRLSAVFARYVEICNQASETRLTVAEFEFSHVQLLNSTDTAEAAALMKHDRIQVKPDQTNERRAQEEYDRVQRETDKEYFTQMASLVDKKKYADCMLVGLPPLDVENPNASYMVPCHSRIIMIRCPWLAAKIRLEQGNVLAKRETRKRLSKDSDEDEMPMLLLYDPPQVNLLVDDGVAQIETDEDEISLYVHLSHPPEAIQILLEYCYSNRVVSLGRDAFVQGCKTRLDLKKQIGPVPPFPGTAASGRGWPNRGSPTISFAAASAGILLAGEATLPRLSLMCEVAAAELVAMTNVVDALALCQTHVNQTGNTLPILRKAAMDLVLQTISRDTSALRKAFAERKVELVPTLLSGAMEAVEVVEPKTKVPSSVLASGSKRDWKTMLSEGSFDRIDRDDLYLRDQERRRRRLERGADMSDEEDPEWQGAHRKVRRRVRKVKIGIRFGVRSPSL